MTTSSQNELDRAKILLVDDLNGNLLALEGLLKRESIEIFKAKCGTEALDLMILHDFAVALIDVQMPGMSGFELAEIMRGTNKTKYIPIIFVTATAKDQAFSFKGYESGAVDFLQKPLDTHAVKSKVGIFVELFCRKRELKRQLQIISNIQSVQAELVEKLQKTQADLELAVKIRDEFMSIASHELKTPLTSLKLQTQLRIRKLGKGDFNSFGPEQLKKMFDTDQRQLDRITRLIDDMLDISLIGSGKLSMNLERFDLCELIRDLLERLSESFVIAECTLTIDLCLSAVGNWDRFRLEQVITNLITNALRYGAKKPIHIQVTCTSLSVQVNVSDQGMGIAKENYERIFQKFERAVSANEVCGLGLGLYIVKQIIEAHQGSIRVESQIGLGSTFIVELPLVL